jgi:hypothetical protein
VRPVLVEDYELLALLGSKRCLRCRLSDPSGTTPYDGPATL